MEMAKVAFERARGRGDDYIVFYTAPHLRIIKSGSWGKLGILHIKLLHSGTDFSKALMFDTARPWDELEEALRNRNYHWV